MFEDHEDLMNRIDEPDLEATPESVLVLKNGGPIGRPGNARIWESSNPDKATQTGHQGHGAYLGFPDEWNRLRDSGVAYHSLNLLPGGLWHWLKMVTRFSLTPPTVDLTC